MKKVFSLLIVAMACVAISCGGNANKAADQAEATEVVVVEQTVVADSTACCNADSTCTKGEGGECCKEAEKKAE